MKYFTLEELCATKTGITNIPSWQAVENLKALEVLEKLNPEILQRIDDIAGTKPRLPEY